MKYLDFLLGYFPSLVEYEQCHVGTFREHDAGIIITRSRGKVKDKQETGNSNLECGHSCWPDWRSTNLKKIKKKE